MDNVQLGYFWVTSIYFLLVILEKLGGSVQAPFPKTLPYLGPKSAIISPK